MDNDYSKNAVAVAEWEEGDNKEEVATPIPK